MKFPGEFDETVPDALRRAVWKLPIWSFDLGVFPVEMLPMFGRRFGGLPLGIQKFLSFSLGGFGGLGRRQCGR